MGSGRCPSFLGCTILLILLEILPQCAPFRPSPNCSDYYSSSCPRASEIIRLQVFEIMLVDKNLAGALLRLHFHDCFVRGCDASILLDSPNHTGEKDAVVNNNLRGYEEIDAIKAVLELECPGVVSCADVLALAARDAVVLTGGRGWFVDLGRKDGFVTRAEEAQVAIPNPQASFGELVDSFSAKGFDAREMVILSGGHTIGRSFCEPVVPRLYDFEGVPGRVDPTLDPVFAARLRELCPRGQVGSILSMDPSKSRFDRLYFEAVLANRGLFHSDAQLLAADVGRDLVTRYSNPASSFFFDFGAAMNKMSRLAGLPQGEVRRNCRVVNG